MDTTSNKKTKRKSTKKLPKSKKKETKSGKVKIYNAPSKATRRKHKLNKKAKAMIYLGHIPHGFYEDEMTAYFNQFGKVLAASVARSKKTGRSKGYGFVEFADEEVAKIAAETMNNYLMFNRVLKCRYIPPEERKGKLHVRTMFLTDCPGKHNKIATRKEKNNAFAKLTQDSYTKKAQKKMKQFEKFFHDQGIEFTFKVKRNNLNTVQDVSKISVKDSDSDTSSNSESDDDTDNQFGVLEIDESDNEIHFKTPPQVKKVIKKSENSPAPIENSKKENKLKNTKNSSIVKEEISGKQFKFKEATGSKTQVKSQGIGRKLQKKTNLKEKQSLSKSFKVKKNNVSLNVEMMKFGVQEMIKTNKISNKNKINKGNNSVTSKSKNLVAVKSSARTLKKK